MHARQQVVALGKYVTHMRGVAVDGIVCWCMANQSADGALNKNTADCGQPASSYTCVCAQGVCVAAQGAKSIKYIPIRARINCTHTLTLNREYDHLNTKLARTEELRKNCKTNTHRQRTANWISLGVRGLCANDYWHFGARSLLGCPSHQPDSKPCS